MNDVLSKLAVAVSEDEDLETLVKSLLELLEVVTGLESTYLTHIDTEMGVQKIVFARNSKDLSIPEGLVVPWDDTLCKRAIDEGQMFTDDVRNCWGDSEAARELGLTTYVSEPVCIGDNELYGTLCGASKQKVPVSDEARHLMSMFGKLIARQLERDQLLAALRREHITLREYALTDPLTGIPNRRAMEVELKRSLANADRANSVIHLAFIDLDGFKAINDDYGHDAGDRFLIEMARKIRTGLREGDFIARIGGDEFVVFGSAFSSDYAGSRKAIQKRIEALSKGTFHLGTTDIDYEGASVGVVSSESGMKDPETLISLADDAMYSVKNTRRKAVAGSQ